MKVLHYIECADLTFCVPWVDLMKELENQGVQQALLCRPGGRLEKVAREQGIEVVTWKPAVTNLPAVNLKFKSIIKQTRPDVIHTRLSSAANIAGFWGKRFGIPVIAMLDGAYNFKYYSNASHYMACSQWAKDHIVSQGVESERVDVVYNSINVKKYLPDETAVEVRKKFRTENNISPEDKVFVGAGSFFPGKGFECLIRAFASLAKNYKSTKLLIAGDGPLRACYLDLISSLGIKESVIVSKAFVPDIRPWLWSADFFVLPSRIEAFGIIILEAMASGLPAIVTNNRGPGELVDDGINGLTFPPDDVEAMRSAMERYLNMGDEETERIRNTATVRLQNFTSFSLATRQMEIYKKVLSRESH